MVHPYIDIALDQRVSEELETDVDLGTSGADDAFGAFVGDQPIAMRVRDVFQTFGKSEPEEFALYKMFEVWLVPHRFSLIRRKGLAEPVSLGMEVEYQHDNTTCSVISMLPCPSWRAHGKASVESNIFGKLSATGELSEQGDSSLKPKLNLGNLGFGLSGSGQVGFSFKWSVATPVISAVGQGSSRCEWRFDRDEEPLYGRTIETWSVLALPKRQAQLSYRIRCYYLLRTLFFPTRRQGEFQTIACRLAV